MLTGCSDLPVHNGALSTMTQDLFGTESYVAHSDSIRVLLWKKTIFKYIISDSENWAKTVTQVLTKHQQSSM